VTAQSSDPIGTVATADAVNGPASSQATLTFEIPTTNIASFLSGVSDATVTVRGTNHPTPLSLNFALTLPGDSGFYTYICYAQGGYNALKDTELTFSEKTSRTMDSGTNPLASDTYIGVNIVDFFKSIPQSLFTCV